MSISGFQRSAFQFGAFQTAVQTASFLFGGETRKRKKRVEEHPDVKTNKLAAFAATKLVRPLVSIDDGDDELIAMLLAL